MAATPAAGRQARRGHRVSGRAQVRARVAVEGDNALHHSREQLGQPRRLCSRISSCHRQLDSRAGHSSRRRHTSTTTMGTTIAAHRHLAMLPRRWDRSQHRPTISRSRQTSCSPLARASSAPVALPQAGNKSITIAGARAATPRHLHRLLRPRRLCQARPRPRHLRASMSPSAARGRAAQRRQAPSPSQRPCQQRRVSA